MNRPGRASGIQREISASFEAHAEQETPDHRAHEQRGVKLSQFVHAFLFSGFQIQRFLCH